MRQFAGRNGPVASTKMRPSPGHWFEVEAPAGDSGIGLHPSDFWRRGLFPVILRQAFALAEKLAADYPDQPKYRANLADILNQLTATLDQAGDRQEAMESAQRAFDLRKQLAAEFPAVIAYRHELANAHNSLGWCLCRSHAPAAAVLHYRQTIDIQTRLIAEGLNTPVARYRLARAHVNLGAVLAELNDPEGKEQMRKAIPMYAELVASAEKDRNLPTGDWVDLSRLRRDLGATHCVLGLRLKERGDPAAEEHLAQSLAIQTELVADVPNVPYYGGELAFTQLALGQLLLDGGRSTDAEKLYRQALEGLTALVAAHPGITDNRIRLAECHKNLGALLSVNGERDRAAEHRCLAQANYEELVTKFPSVIDYRVSLGGILMEQGKLAAAEQYRQAIQLATRTVAEYPNVPSYRKTLADSHRHLGTLLNHDGERDRAAEHLRLAQASYQELVTKFPNVIDYRLELAAMLAAIGRNREAKEVYVKCLELEPQNARVNDKVAWFLVVCPDPQYRDSKRALQLAKEAVSLAPKDASSWNTLGVAHYRTESWKEAISALTKATQLRQGDDSLDWFFLAMARWQLGDKKQARQSYERAVQTMEKDTSIYAEEQEFRCFRAEATTLLGLKEPPTPTGKETPPKKK